MNSYDVQWSAQARRDLHQIHAYIQAEDSDQRAAHVVRGPVERARVLATFPQAYPRHRRGGAGEGVQRFLPKGRYSIVFEVDEGAGIVVIAAVEHAHRNT